LPELIFRKEFISDLMHKNRRSERGIRQLWRSIGITKPKNVLVFQMAEITVEEEKCGCIYAIREGKCY
jgi:hypothetical protein